MLNRMRMRMRGRLDFSFRLCCRFHSRHSIACRRLCGLFLFGWCRSRSRRAFSSSATPTAPFPSTLSLAFFAIAALWRGRFHLRLRFCFAVRFLAASRFFHAWICRLQRSLIRLHRTGSRLSSSSPLHLHHALVTHSPRSRQRGYRQLTTKDTNASKGPISDSQKLPVDAAVSHHEPDFTDP